MQHRFSCAAFALVCAVAVAVAACGGKESAEATDEKAAPIPAPTAPNDVAVDVPAPVVDVPSDLGAPLTGATRAWTWVDVPESRCMNDTATGIGVNLVPGAKRVVVYLEGGGACFDSITCLAGTAHQEGFNGATFAGEMAAIGGIGIFDRRNANNPFKDDSWVFVPYCTGDVHAGANTSGALGRKHFGYVNIGHYLKRIVPTFSADKGVTDVVLAGSSAGGIGAAFNFDRVQRSFKDVRVHLLDDAGPVLADDWSKPCLQAKMRDAWRIDLTAPADCATCKGNFGALLPFLATKYPASRMGLVIGLWDDVIRTFMGAGYAGCSGVGVMLPTDLAAGLDALHRLARRDAQRARILSALEQTYVVARSAAGRDRLGGPAERGPDGVVARPSRRRRRLPRRRSVTWWQASRSDRAFTWMARAARSILE